MRARARPLFLRTVFQILFRISQSNGKNENPKTDISALKSVFGFRVRWEIRNPDFENLNPDFPIERTLIRRRPQQRLQTNNRFNDQNNSSARASRFLIHFFHVHCTTTTRFLWRTWTYDDEFSFIFLNLNQILKNTTPRKVVCI